MWGPSGLISVPSSAPQTSEPTELTQEDNRRKTQYLQAWVIWLGPTAG